MPSENWTEETVPSRRTDRAGDGPLDGGSRLSQIPARVWIFAFVAAVLLFALFGLWALFLFRGRLGAPGPTPTAIIWTPTPSPTPLANPTPTPTQARVPQDPDAATPTASAGIAIGGYVKVTGTSGYGLSLREGPGANYARMDVAAEDDVFVVVGGPQTAAGSSWWRIRDPEDEERIWWAIGNYLQPIERP